MSSQCSQKLLSNVGAYVPGVGRAKPNDFPGLPSLSVLLLALLLVLEDVLVPCLLHGVLEGLDLCQEHFLAAADS